MVVEYKFKSVAAALLVLKLFNLLALELNNFSALHANHMVVMAFHTDPLEKFAVS